MVWGFGKKDKGGIPEVSERPLKAYVRRTKPERVGRRQVAGKIKGDFDGWTMVEELEDMVTEQCGGGTFQCKVFDQEDKKKYVGCHTFTSPGEPLIDGEPIPQDEPSTNRSTSKIEDKIEEARLQAELEKTRIKSEKELKELRGDDDDDDDDGPQFQMPGQNDEVQELKEELRRMREDQAEERRRHERELQEEKHRREMQELRDTFKSEIAELKSAMNNGGGNRHDGVLAAQLKSTEAMIAAMNQQTQVILTSQSELTKTLLTQASKSDSNERADRLMEKLIDEKSSTGSEVMNAMKEAYNTGIQMARGAEPSPTTFPDVLKELSGRALETVDSFIQAKGQVATEGVKQEINNAVQRAVNHIGRQIAPLLANRPQTPVGGIPAHSAAASLPAPNPVDGSTHPQQPAAPQATPQNPQPMTREQLREIVDNVMQQFLEDMPTQSQNWAEMAKQQIPADILAEVSEWNFDNLIAFAYKYGSEEVVTDVMLKLAEMGAQTPEESQQLREAVNQIKGNQQINPGAIVTEPGTQASAPSESDEGLFADEDEGDDFDMPDTSPQEGGGVTENLETPHVSVEPSAAEVGAVAVVAPSRARPKTAKKRAKKKR